MSQKKFDSLVEDMVHKAELRQWELAKRVGNLFKVIYSEISAIKKTVPVQNPKVFIRLAKKNLGKRVKSSKSRF